MSELMAKVIQIKRIALVIQIWNELAIMSATSSAQASLIHSTTLELPGERILPAVVNDFGACKSQ
jgi:hypothetical protein